MALSPPSTAFALQSITYAGNTITLHFDRAVTANNGNIIISDGYAQSYVGANGLSTRIVGATDVHKLDDSDPQISYNGSNVVITLSSPLKAGVSYSVTMQAGAVKDAGFGTNTAISSPKLFPFTASGTPAAAPATPSAVVDASIHFTDDGASSSDYITSALAQVVSGTYSGTLGANEFIQVSLDNGASWHKATIGSAGGWSYSGQIDTGNLIGGSGGTLLARVSSTAGGSSATASQAYQYSAAAGPQPIEAYINESFSFSSDSGSSEIDRVTNVASQTVSGSYSGTLHSGQKLQLSVDDGTTWITASAANGSWQASATLLTGSHDLQARVVDAGGNSGSVTYGAYQLITSTVSLGGRELTLAAGSDTGISSTDGLTNNPQAVQLHVAGLHGFHAGDTIEIIDVAHGSAVVGSYVIQTGDLYYGDDYFSVNQYNSLPRNTVDIDLDGTLADGAHTLQARVVDLAGNTAAASIVANITVDTQGYGNDTLTGNHFIETHASLTGTLSAAAAIADQVVEVTLDHGASWQQAALTATDATHAAWNLAGIDLSVALEYGVRLSDAAGNASGTSYYLSARDTGYDHPEYNDIVLYAGGGIDNITVGARARVDGGGGYGDQITTGDDAYVVVGNDSKVVTGNGSNFVSTGFGADITTGSGNDTIFCSTIDGVKIRAGLGTDKLTANTAVDAMVMGSSSLDVQGIEELHFGSSYVNDLTILTGANVRTFSDSGKLTITADFSSAFVHLGAEWQSDGVQGGYKAYHTSGGEILLIGQNITVDTGVGSI